MSKRVISYVPSLVRVKLFGMHVEGFSPEGIADIERTENATTTRKATDGSRTAFVDRYATYRVSIHLMQASPSNTWLHQLFKVYQKVGVEFKIPLDIDDKSDGSDFSTFSAVDVFFETEPSTSYTSTGDAVTTWTFECHDGKYARYGAYSDNDVVEKLTYLFEILDTAEKFGFGLEELAVTTENMLSTALDVGGTFLERFQQGG